MTSLCPAAPEPQSQTTSVTRGDPDGGDSGCPETSPVRGRREERRRAASGNERVQEDEERRSMEEDERRRERGRLRALMEERLHQDELCSIQKDLSIRKKIYRTAKVTSGFFITIGLILVFYIITLTIIGETSMIDIFHFDQSDAERQTGFFNQTGHGRISSSDWLYVVEDSHVVGENESELLRAENLIADKTLFPNVPINDINSLSYNEESSASSNNNSFLLLNESFVDDASVKEEINATFSKTKLSHIPDTIAPYNDTFKWPGNSKISDREPVNERDSESDIPLPSPEKYTLQRPLFRRPPQYSQHPDRNYHSRLRGPGPSSSIIGRDQIADEIERRKEYTRHSQNRHKWRQDLSGQSRRRVHYDPLNQYKFTRPVLQGGSSGAGRPQPNTDQEIWDSIHQIMQERQYLQPLEMESHQTSFYRRSRPPLLDRRYRRPPPTFRRFPPQSSPLRPRPVRRPMSFPRRSPHQRFPRGPPPPRAPRKEIRNIRSRHQPPPEFRYPSDARNIQDIISYMNDGDQDRSRSQYDNQDDFYQDERLPHGHIMGDQDHVLPPQHGHHSNDGHFNTYEGEDGFHEDHADHGHIIDDHAHYNDWYNYRDDEREKGEVGSIYQSDYYIDHPLTNKDHYHRPVHSKDSKYADTYNYDGGKSYSPIYEYQPSSKSKPVDIVMDIYPVGNGKYTSKNSVIQGGSTRQLFGQESFRNDQGYNPAGFKHEIVLHLNLYSRKPSLRRSGYNGRYSERSSSGSESDAHVSLDVPVRGRLTLEDLLNAIMETSRGGSPVALGYLSPEGRESVDMRSEFSYSQGLLSGEEVPIIRDALRAGLQELNLYLPPEKKFDLSYSSQNYNNEFSGNSDTSYSSSDINFNLNHNHKYPHNVEERHPSAPTTTVRTEGNKPTEKEVPAADRTSTTNLPEPLPTPCWFGSSWRPSRIC